MIPHDKSITSTEEVEIVSPNVEKTIEVMRLFQEIKEKVLDDNDIVIISNKKYIKRSGWRKIALAFNITTEIREIQREKMDDKYIVRVIARAVAPNGRISEEVGISDSSEFTGNLKATMHNIESKAVTRAINRAISNLVGGGELSAEEIIEGSELESNEISRNEQKNEQKKNEINKNEIMEKVEKLINDFLAMRNLKVKYSVNKENYEIRMEYIIDYKTFSDLERNLNRLGFERIGVENNESIWKLKIQ
ncbi:MAG: hypothetical protein ACP5L4_01925 [Thermoplasmata archaeon]